MILFDAIDTAARFGMTLFYNSEFEEYVVYPKGSSPDDPSAYFTTDINDAVDTARLMGADQ